MKLLESLFFANNNICYICKENSNNKGRYICSDCYKKVEVLNKKYSKNIEYLDEIFYSALFNKFNRSLVTKFKFNDRSYLYKPIGEIMIKTLEELLTKNIDYIIPIPIHRKKLAKRGYNQSYLLAKYIGNELGIDVLNDVLIKIKNTNPQSSLDALERSSNLEDSLTIKNIDKIKDKNIILVDDIITTGNTLKNSAKLMKKSGAKSIIGLTFLSAKN